jgi:exopolysaccharide production protein ExoQ
VSRLPIRRAALVDRLKSALSRRLEPRMQTIVLGLVLVLLGWLGGFIATRSPRLALLVVISLAFMTWWLLPGNPRIVTTPKPFRWIPVAWLIVFFASNIKTSFTRSTLQAASGSINSDYIVELTGYLLVGAMTAFVWFHREPRRSGLAGWPLVLWPAFALISTAWSPIPLFTLVRSTQLIVVSALGLFCLRLAAAEPRLGRLITRDSLVLFVGVTALLSMLGLADRSYWENDRFMWPTGQHPIVVGMVAGAALLIVLVGGRSLLGLSRWLQVTLVALFSSVLILGQNRSVLISTMVAVVVSLWTLRDGKEAWARYIAFPALMLGGLVVAVSLSDALITYFSRGQSAQSLESFTGRTYLWEAALGQFKTAPRWLVGFGYGSTRVILIRLFSWAGEAHSSILEILLGLGIVGATMAIMSWIAIGHRVFSRRARPRVASAVEAAIFAHLIVIGFVEAALVLPGFGYSMMAFIFVAASVRSSVDARTGLGRQSTYDSHTIQRTSRVAG